MKRSIIALLLMIFLVGCGDDSQPVEEKSPVELEETSSLVFRNMDLQMEANTFTLTGEVQAEGQVFYYRLEQGEEELQGEEKYELQGAEGNWEEFVITEEIPATAFDAEAAPILTLYGKSEDGEVIHPNYIPIDLES